MLRTRAAFIAGAQATLLLVFACPALAASAAPTPTPGDTPPITVNPAPGSGGVGIGVQDPGSPGSSSPGSPGITPDPVTSPHGTCTWKLDTIDNIELLNGDLSKGAWFTETCADGYTTSVYVPVGTPVGGTPPTKTPAQLAAEAEKLLVLPKPSIYRSPSQDNSDHGTAFTWVRLFTWFWSDPAPWTTPPTKTADDGVRSATVVATPTALTFDPGNGDTPVVCHGPGRAWTPRDGKAAPTDGGCAYKYLHVVPPPGTVTAKVSITWSIHWTASDGEQGDLPAQTTSATSTFLVEQIQVVTQ